MAEYFKDEELRCRCGCGTLMFDPVFRKKLNEIRHIYGKPMLITSGYRCKNHPVEKKKPIPGTHALGCAVDISVNDSRTRFELMKIAMDSGITRIGFADTFLHFDFGDKINQKQFQPNVAWKY